MFDERYNQHMDCFKKLYLLKEQITSVGEYLGEAINKKNKILICGNGGSASDSQHFAAEVVGRYLKERKGRPSIALTTDTSILTAVGNDYGYDKIFERQVEALGSNGDWLIGISTSGNSENVVRAIIKAKEIGVRTAALLGRNGGQLKDLAEYAVVIQDDSTARIQEGHIFILHIWAEIIEEMLMQ